MNVLSKRIKGLHTTAGVGVYEGKNMKTENDLALKRDACLFRNGILPIILKSVTDIKCFFYPQLISVQPAFKLLKLGV